MRGDVSIQCAYGTALPVAAVLKSNAGDPIDITGYTARLALLKFDDCSAYTTVLQVTSAGGAITNGGANGTFTATVTAPQTQALSEYFGAPTPTRAGRYELYVTPSGGSEFLLAHGDVTYLPAGTAVTATSQDVYESSFQVTVTAFAPVGPQGPPGPSGITDPVTYVANGAMIAADKRAHDAMMAVVINANAPPWNLLGDNTDESAGIAALFAHAATLTATGGCVIEFRNGTYRGLNNTNIPQFCTVHANGAEFIRAAVAGCGAGFRHDAPLNIGQPSDTLIHDAKITIEALSDSSTRWQPGATFTVGQIVRPRNLVAALRGAPALTFNAAAKTIVRAAGSWLLEGFGSATSVNVTGTASNNISGAVIASVTATTITLVASVLANEGPTAGGFVFSNETALITPSSHCLKLLSQSGVTGAHLAIGDLSPLEQLPAIQFRGAAATDHQSAVKVITGGALGVMTFQYASNGVAFGATQTTTYDPRGFTWATGNGTLAIYFPCRQSSEYIATTVYTPIPRVEVRGVPASDSVNVDVQVMTSGPLGTMQFRVGYSIAPTQDEHLAGGCVTFGSTQNTTAGAAYYDYAIPGTAQTVRFHAGQYVANGSVSYFTPAQGHSIREGTQILDGGHIWEVQPPAMCVDMNAMGHITYEKVVFDGGNFGPVVNQAEGVTFRDCSFYRAAGAGGFCTNDGTITPGASGGYSNTVRVEGRTTLTTEAYGWVHDGGYTFLFSGCGTYQRCQRGMLFLTGVTCCQVGPGIYSETSGVFARNACCFSRVAGASAFDQLCFQNVLFFTGGAAGIDIVTSTASGLSVSCSRFNAAVGISGLASVDDVDIDFATVHNAGGPVTDGRARARYFLPNSGAMLYGAPFAPGKAALPLANGVNNNIAFPGGTPYTRLEVTGPTTLFTVAGFTAGVDGQELEIYWTSTGCICEVPHQAGTSSTINQTATRSTKSVYIYGPGSGGVSWARFRYSYSRWRLYEHSGAYHEGQTGTTTLVSGLSPIITAAMTSTSRILAFATALKGPTAATQYIALAPDRANGDPLNGSFRLRSVAAARMQGTPSLTFSTGPNKIVRSAGDWAADGLVNGDGIVVFGAAQAANNCATSITALTATDLTVSATLATENNVAGCTVAKLLLDCNDTLSWFIQDMS